MVAGVVDRLVLLQQFDGAVDSIGHWSPPELVRASYYTSSVCGRGRGAQRWREKGGIEMMQLRFAEIQGVPGYSNIIPSGEKINP